MLEPDVVALAPEHVDRVGDAGYADPISHGRDDVATSAALSGLEVPVNDLMDAR